MSEDSPNENHLIGVVDKRDQAIAITTDVENGEIANRISGGKNSSYLYKILKLGA